MTRHSGCNGNSGAIGANFGLKNGKMENFQWLGLVGMPIQYCPNFSWLWRNKQISDTSTRITKDWWYWETKGGCVRHCNAFECSVMGPRSMNRTHSEFFNCAHGEINVWDCSGFNTSKSLETCQYKVLPPRLKIWSHWAKPNLTTLHPLLCWGGKWATQAIGVIYWSIMELC